MDVPGYELAQEVQQHGPYVVHRARRRRDAVPVLLKRPRAHPADPADIAALERECALLRAIALPGVPRARDLVRVGGSVCLVLEDRGWNILRPALYRGAAQRPSFFALARNLCAVLGGLHAQEVVVVNLEPAAVLVGDAPDAVEILHLHGALSRSIDRRPPSPMRVTPYTSPEGTGRIGRTLDYRADFYALGVICYELLTGVLPFASDDPLELLHAHLARMPVSPSLIEPEVPEQLSRIVLRLMMKAPEDRYQSSAGIVHDLTRCEREWTTTGAIEPFTLGARDVPERFLVPRRLYGREHERRVLLDVFDATVGGRTSLLLVSGYAGVGKTALIQDWYKPIVRGRGCFTSGKFDQIARNVPYGALAQALRGLVWQLLTAPEDALATWRARLTGALGATGGVLAEVVPEIELVLGPQVPPPAVDAAEAQNRFRYVLQSFVSAVAREDHPLVVFLDDLQWVDRATLDVLQALLSGAGIRHLLVVGACRDQDEEADRILPGAIEQLRQAGARVDHLSLAPLAEADIAQLLRDTFHAEPSDVAPLAALVHRKTGGNPFFGVQFLAALEQEQLIAFDRTRGAWTFRIDAIGRAAQTENIVDLMTRRIRRLSPAGQQAIMLAASLGNRFDWSAFAAATRQPADEAAAGLSEALQAGLIQLIGAADGDPAREPGYAFLHDRVQQAAYALIPEDRRGPLHLDIGRLLLGRCQADVPDERVFEIANHLNIGSTLVGDRAERLRIARVNLAAGRKAKASAAYQAAAEYLRAGVELAGEGQWDSEYALLFPLYLEAAECHYLAGSFADAARHFAVLEEHAASASDRAQVYGLRIVLAENQGQFAHAVSLGREALALFGLHLPRDAASAAAALDREIDAIDGAMDGRSIADLVDLPPLTDEPLRTAMGILTSLWAPAYICGEQLVARLISAMLVRLSLTHGNTADSAYGYVTHAITVGPVRGAYDAAYDWGELAIAVNDRFQDRKRRAKIHQQFQAHVSFWRRPFEACIPHAREATRIGIETGDFTYAGYGAMSESWPALLVSRSLDEFLHQYTPTLAVLDRLKMGAFRAAHHVVLNWARALQGKTKGRLSLSDESFDEHAYRAAHEGGDPFLLMFLYAARLHLAVLLEEPEEARRAADRAREVAIPGTIWPVFIEFWRSLALAATYLEDTAASRASTREQLAGTERALAALAVHCPENFKCWWLLVSAEIARVDADLTRAVRLCDEALAWGRETANVQHEALALELAGRAWIARGREHLGAAYLADAHRAYAVWGASAKTADLERRYGRLLAARSVGAARGAHSSSHETSPSTVDMATVVKLANSIAAEMHTGGLLHQLMTLAIEHAGADRGLFLQEHDGRVVVVAAASAHPDAVQVVIPARAEPPSRAALSVIRYVHRTRQEVVVDSPSHDERFAGDPHLAGGGARSILCVPVVHQERIGGVLYLENTLTPHAFSAARTEVTRILATQTAISLENARLYEQMKAEVDRRTAAEDALRQALGELQVLKDRLEAENVYLQEEIRTQHNFNEIVGNSPALLETLRKVERVAPTDSTVLIVGETGSGKELIARAVHSRSRRHQRPLVKVNCGAIAPGLVESELFGHVKGAFTGAIDKRVGRFEVADGGTIFLDEIGELPLEAQVKLLRVLQEQEFEPVGSSRTIRVSVRVIAATNRDLDQAVQEGKFRADLLYRLNVFPIEVPPLRRRGADIELLARFFLMGLSRRLGKPFQGFSVRTVQRLAAYAWPGNVRELQNVVERAAILAHGPIVEADAVLPDAPALRPPEGPSPAGETLDAAQRAHILKVLARTGGVVEGSKGAAAILGMHANTLRSRMKKLGIRAGDR